MMMEFYFSEEKAKRNRYDINKLYKVLDKYFKKYGIESVSQGVYQAPDTQNSFNAMSYATCFFTENDWFLKVIDKWYWRVESDDIDDREDVLESHYKITALNNM